MRLMLRTLLTGLLTYLPGLHHLAGRGTGGTDDARYCYKVWLKHLTAAHDQGCSVEHESVTELGPGDSLGTGLAALLSGAERYYALDVVHHAGYRRTSAIFDQLVDLFKHRIPPADGERFPDHILTAERLAWTLRPDRVAAIRRALASLHSPAAGATGDALLEYIVPWRDTTVLGPESVQMVFSHSVLCYVADLVDVYGAMCRWLKPGGLMSHEIDFGSLGTATAWNGHWTYSDRLWRLMCERRPFAPNREPLSVHIGIISDLGLRISSCRPKCQRSAIARSQLAPRFEYFSDLDLTTRSCFIQAIKAADRAGSASFMGAVAGSIG